MKNFINRIDKLLRDYNLINYNRLQPPLPDCEIEYYLQMIGIEDMDVFELYRWKNGVSPSLENRAMLFSSRVSLLSLERVLYLKGIQDDELDENHIILFSGPYETSFLFNTSPGDSYGKLHIHSVPLLSIENPYSYYDSLTTMLESNIKAYEEGFFEYDKRNDIINYDSLKVGDIARKLNPKSNFWQPE